MTQSIRRVPPTLLDRDPSRSQAKGECTKFHVKEVW